MLPKPCPVVVSQLCQNVCVDTECICQKNDKTYEETRLFPPAAASGLPRFSLCQTFQIVNGNLMKR